MLGLHFAASLSLLLAPAPAHIGRARPAPRARAPPACAAPEPEAGDALLMAAMEALKLREVEGAETLLEQASEAYEVGGQLTPQRLELLQMVRKRVEQARPKDEPAELSERRGGSGEVKAVAAKLAAKLGPVAWEPMASSPAAAQATREGDAAVSRTSEQAGHCPDGTLTSAPQPSPPHSPAPTRALVPPTLRPTCRSQRARTQGVRRGV